VDGVLMQWWTSTEDWVSNQIQKASRACSGIQDISRLNELTAGIVFLVINPHPGSCLLFGQ
jgi:hypothetical protein